jgi:hypothetical protein
LAPRRQSRERSPTSTAAPKPAVPHHRLAGGRVAPRRAQSERRFRLARASAKRPHRRRALLSATSSCSREIAASSPVESERARAAGLARFAAAAWAVENSESAWAMVSSG